MKAAKALMMGLGASGGAVPGGGLYVDDVFSAYTYTGNGATQTIANGIDLAGHGGMVWFKARSVAYDHELTYTSMTLGNYLLTNSTSSEYSHANGLTSFNSNGFSIGNDFRENYSGDVYVSWTFRNAPRFYGHQVVTKLSGSNRTVNFPELVTLGMVRVKRTDQPGSWYVWHRSLPAGQLLIGETNVAAATLGHITVSGTSVTLVNGVIADGTYLVEAWAHDEALDGIVQCGSFTTDAGGNATVNLGWEPQMLVLKPSSSSGNWQMMDSIRGWVADPNYSPGIFANLSNAEHSQSGAITPTATGMKTLNNGLTDNTTSIYLAIRRPNKPPTSGTQVYNAIARTGTDAAATVTGMGFAPDLCMVKPRGGTYNADWADRLRGRSQYLIPDSTTSEKTAASTTSDLVSFEMDGVKVGTWDQSTFNYTGTLIHHFFKRAKGFFDIVCDTGTGSTHGITHGLSAAPEFIIRKSRSGSTQWECWHSALAATEKLVLNSTAAKATDTASWNSTLPTSTQFTVGTGANVNINAATYVTYLFATLAGISKVGSYTGNGSNQTIPCGFSTGSRFVLVKRIDNTGDWFVWDTARGITPTTDPHLSLNTMAAEVTTDDSIDQDASGFVVNQNAATNINALGGNYLFLAIA